MRARSDSRRQLAQVVGCSLAEALPAVRREVEIAPNQSDETLIKRAAYHYRQAIPETACRLYRDPSPGWKVIPTPRSGRVGLILEDGLMRTMILAVGVALAVLPIHGSSARGQVASGKAGEDSFDSKVRPVLVAHCYGCHSKEAVKAEGELSCRSPRS